MKTIFLCIGVVGGMMSFCTEVKQEIKVMPARLTDEQILEKLETAKKQVKIGASYYHHQKPEVMYVVQDVALLTSNTEPVVIYARDLEDGKQMTWVRTLEEFVGMVETQAGLTSRFVKK